MQTTARKNLQPAIKGLLLTRARKSRPLLLALLAQTTTIVFTAGALTTDVVLTVTDDETGQVYSVTSTGSATEATMLANLTAAVRANGKLNQLLSISDDATLTSTLAFRMANRPYTVACTGGPSSTQPVVTNTVTAGGTGLEFGQLVARASGDGEFTAMTASTTVRDIAGFLARTDANHFHKLEGELPSDVDRCRRGVHYAIAEECEGWVEVSEAVTPASRPHVRIEGSDVGDWGDTPAGTAQTVTVTPIVNMGIYGFAFSCTTGGRIYRVRAQYMPTDATTSIADACAGLFDHVTEVIAALGLGSVLTPTDNSTTLTIAGAAGVLLSEGAADVWYADAEVATATVAISTADVDLLDVSEIARYTSSASAGGLARVKIRVLV